MTPKNFDRYHVSAHEDYEPGSDNQVLSNYLGIQSKEIMGQLEAKTLEHAELAMIELFNENDQVTIEHICALHKLWLGDIYPFAGKFRSVNMSKDGFPFAAAKYVSGCMNQFEKKYLKQYTPCRDTNIQSLAYC